MLQGLWRNLKRLRKIRLGPIALAFKFERATSITSNSRHRLTSALSRHKNWVQSLPAPADDRELAAPQRAVQLHESTRLLAHGAGELALIIGVGPGFGYALARRLASEGMAVVLASRDAHRLDALASEIEATGGISFAYGCDATCERSVTELFAHVKKLHGVPNLVVYSLQSFGPGQAIEIELPAFEDGFRRNCLGAFLVAREAARSMLPLNRGTIVLTGSTSSLIGRAGHLNLAVGKFGQRALAQVLARELWPKGIHVAHLVIDADIHEGVDSDEGAPQSDPNHLAELVVSLHRQPNTAWTSELDARPWNERFWEHC